MPAYAPSRDLLERLERLERHGFDRTRLDPADTRASSGNVTGFPAGDRR
ncbi:hypothetical protein [Amycolatopsis ultiminotia]